MSDNQNLTRIKVVYNALEDLAEKVVFIGGATVSMYRDRPAEETRPTDDVDIVIELIKYEQYANIEEQLRKKGFANDIESGVICRYIVQGIIVDVMPTNEDILGFANRWYVKGFRSSIKYNIDEATSVRIFSPEYFIASKLEAFLDRGNNDGRMSSDFEDIVYVLNNRSTIWDELKSADEEIKDFLAATFKDLIEQDVLNEWTSSHLEFSEQRRVDYIIGGINDFVNN